MGQKCPIRNVPTGTTGLTDTKNGKNDQKGPKRTVPFGQGGNNDISIIRNTE